MTTLTRDDTTHTYRDDLSRVWPGVTSILGGSTPDARGRRVWPGVPPWAGRFDRIPADVLEYKRQLGTAVHAAIALDCAGTLDESSIAEVIAPYLAGWRRWRDETGFVASIAECLVYHATFGYCGTLDAIGTVRGGTILADWKTSDASTGLDAGAQTAAYLEAYRAMYPGVLPARVPRYSVHLTDDGKYHVVPHTNRRDFEAFKAALELFNFAALRR
jgi:hypothetical protein